MRRPQLAERPQQDRIVIVTGAAQCIGEAPARRFTEDGARLVLSDLAAVAADIATSFPSSAAVGIVADDTDLLACDGLVAAAVARHGGLDVLIVAGAVI